MFTVKIVTDSSRENHLPLNIADRRTFLTIEYRLALQIISKGLNKFLEII